MNEESAKSKPGQPSKRDAPRRRRRESDESGGSNDDDVSRSPERRDLSSSSRVRRPRVIRQQREDENDNDDQQLDIESDRPPAGRPQLVSESSTIFQLLSAKNISPLHSRNSLFKVLSDYCFNVLDRSVSMVS